MKLILDTFSLNLPDLTPSQEGVSEDGMEREYVFYGQMVTKDDLEKATSYSDQEQYRVFVPTKEKDREITARIRKTISWYRNEKGFFAHDPVYHLTIKSFVKGEKGCLEAESELPAEQGQKLLDVFRLADPTQGMIKRRYVFPCGPGYFPDQEEEARVRMKLPENMVWEVDVPMEFLDSKSLSRSEVEDGGCWVKLDLEVKSWDLKINDKGFPMPFPLRLTNVIYQQPGQRDKETEAQIKKIMRFFKPDVTPSTEAVHVNVNIGGGLDYSNPKAIILGTLTVWAALWAIRKGIQGLKKLFSGNRRKPGSRENDIQELNAARREEDRIRVTIKSTFLNGDWLDKHRMEMRAVSGKGIVGPLSLNGRFPVTAVGVTAAVRGEIQEVKRLVQYLKSKGKAKDENVYDDLSFQPDKILGQVEWDRESRKLDITYRQVNDTIVPLSKIDVPNIADLVLECLAVYVELEALASNPKRQNKMNVEWILADSLLETMQALMRWMGRSVKQTSVSTESLQPSLEEMSVLKQIGAGAAAVAGGVAIGAAMVAAIIGVWKGVEWLFGKGKETTRAKFSSKVQYATSDIIDTSIGRIEKTYLNRTWMANAPMARGPINGEGIGTRLSYNGQYSPRGLRNRVEQHLREVMKVAAYYRGPLSKWAVTMNQVATWIHGEAEKLSKGSPGAFSNIDSLLDAASGKIEKSGTPWRTIPLDPSKLLAEAKFVHHGEDRNYLHVTYHDQANLQSLTVDEVGDAAQSLVLVLRAIRDCASQFSSVPPVADGEDTDHFSVIVDGEQVWQSMLGKSTLEDVYWHEWRDDAYRALARQLMETLVQTAEALEKLLSRSVLKKQ